MHGVAAALAPAPAPDVLASTAGIVARQLAPQVRAIDEDAHYPEDVMRALGGAGAYASHLPGPSGGGSLAQAIAANSLVSAVCLSTSFCVWCQQTLAWYLAHSDNPEPMARIGAGVAAGEVLGGTGLSNPMKAFFGIEPMRLKGEPAAQGGWQVSGALPWVSNIGPGHYLGTAFAAEGRTVMTVLPCDNAGVTLRASGPFVALDGTRTYGIQLRGAELDAGWILADPIGPYLKRIRAGFVLLQTGMAFGLIEACIGLMREVSGRLGHVNRYLPQQPDDFAVNLDALRTHVFELAETPYETDPGYWRAVIAARLAAGDMAVAAAHAAMLHQGARGYGRGAAAQRRLREAYFVAIVTPATKQLRKMLADIDAGEAPIL